MVKHTRMEENKRVYKAEYDTDEYENLTCECHHVARSKELNGSRRKPFFCIYCKTVFKDKNKLNLHRIEGCFSVTNDGRKTALKMYPVFGKGQRGEIEDILIKHGYMNPRKKPSRAKRKKSTVALRDTDNSNEVEVGTEAADDRLITVRPQKLKGRGMFSSAREAREKHSTEAHGEIQLPHIHHKQVEDNPESGNFAVVEQGQMQVQMQLTRSQVEVQAWDKAKALFPDFSEVKCPEEVPCPGLGYLMQYKLLPSNFPDVKHDSFLQAFSDFIEEGHIEPGLRSSCGTWYMERETDADEEEQNAVKLTMSRFKLNGGHPDLEARNKERTALQKYLQYLQELTQYESQKTAAEAELRSKREKYVRDMLDEVDAREHVHKEMALWHWSPLLHLLKFDNIRGVPSKPWSHSDAEQREIVQAIMLHRSRNVKDPPHCPTIVRMFKLYMYCFDKARILSDPVAGLLRETMLQLSSKECAAAPVLRHLKISAESVLSEGWLLFANPPTYSESQSEVFEDIDSLLHGSEADREAVVHKVQTFLKIVRQRAAGDMAQLHPNGFSVLWCGGNDIAKADAVEKFMHCLKSREDLDIGWVPFSSGHPDFNCSAVMEAREAVFRATNELHKQRMISDRRRLMTANNHSQTNIPDNHDKFQALVQTCVGTSLKENAHCSANGSDSGKEVLEDASEMGRTLDYFRGSGDLGQSSVTLLSSYKVDSTGTVCHDAGRSKNNRDVVDEPSNDHFKSSPDLNLDLSPADPNGDTIHYDRQPAPHSKTLHMNPVVPTTRSSSHCFEVENPVTPFVGSHHADTRHSPTTSPFPIQPAIPQSKSFIASLNPTQLSRKCPTLSAPASASMHQSMDSCSRGGHALFNPQGSFSSPFTARASNGSHRRSSSPSLRVTGVDADGEH